MLVGDGRIPLRDLGLLLALHRSEPFIFSVMTLALMARSNSLLSLEIRCVGWTQRAVP